MSKNKANLGTYARCCMNCLNRSDCNKFPKKWSLKRWLEWCGEFIPDMRKIDRTRINHANGALINPDSASGVRQTVIQTGSFLERVEASLNAMKPDDVIEKK
jgi:hypothetical protein